MFFLQGISLFINTLIISRKYLLNVVNTVIPHSIEKGVGVVKERRDKKQT